MATHRAQGKRCVYVDGDSLVAAQGSWRESIPLRDIPFTRSGQIPFQVENALAAAAGGETPVVRFVREALAFYFRFHAEWDGFHGAYIHDAMAVAIALGALVLELSRRRDEAVSAPG